MDIKTKISRRIDEHRPHEALLLCLDQIGPKPFAELSPIDLAGLDVVCRRALPELLEKQALWMVNHPDLLHQLLELLTTALAVHYRPAATLDQIAWLRCLLAINEARSGRLERVHEELCLVESRPKTDPMPPPNGRFRQQVQQIELTERSTVGFLQHFFGAYLEFLHRVSQHDLANHLESRINPLLEHIARDEKRPGVVQALFFDESHTGHVRFIHVSTERLRENPDKPPSKGTIQYARHDHNNIDPAMQEAAHIAGQAADAYLKRTGYPDGLDQRLIRWEIANLAGDAVNQPGQFRGGSAALPLAVAILSEYLDRPVANDIALTGAILAAGVAEGRIQPVDGVPEKVKRAVLSGCRFVYIPVANAAELDDKPALSHLVAEHNVRVESVERLDRVCSELFPPEGSGRLLDVFKDTTGNLMEILRPARTRYDLSSGNSAHARHRWHVLTCSVLTAALVFLEGCRLYAAFAPNYPALAAWSRIIASAIMAFVGMTVSFALPAASLRHRKSWSWYAAIKILGICTGIAVFLIGPMLPDFTSISRIYNSPPAAGLMKDMFVIWIFAWVIGANTFHAAAALEHLIARRQFVTARTCLRWDSPLDARMPIRCIYFDWKWGGLVIGIFTTFLIVLELNYYASLKTGTTAAYWEMFLGLGRDMFFLIAIVEVMLFYKMAVANIRRALA